MVELDDIMKAWESNNLEELENYQNQLENSLSKNEEIQKLYDLFNQKEVLENLEKI